MAELQDLPPGWDCKLDARSGRYYYINHYTKTTTWEDPRTRHRHFHGAPKYFTSGVQNEYIPLQDMKPHMSPLTVKSTKVQDSSLTALTDTDEAVAKIAAMFPTVTDTHIRLLLKNCRYMKSIFPQADETIILEVLQNNDNNIQKASDILKEMGYTKKDAVKVAQQKLDAKKEEERKEEEERETKPPSPQIRMKTMEEKKKMKADLQEKHKDVAEHLITIALESVNFDEDRANQILQIMEQEDTQANNKKLEEDQQNAEIDFTSIPSTSSANLPVSQSRQSLKSILKERPDKEKEKSFSRVIEEHGSELSYTSKHLTSTNGPNPNNIKGTNEKLLLEEYVKWQGSNPNIRRGPQSLAKGSNPSFLSGRSYQPCGPNSELRKGPKFGLAKGSIFSQLKTVVVGESRGK